MVRASSCLRVQNFLWQRGGVAHTVAVAEVPVVPFCLHEDILKSVFCKKGQDHPRSAEAKLRAAWCMRRTATHPVDRVGSEWVSCTASETLTCTKQASLALVEEKEEKKLRCHLPLVICSPTTCFDQVKPPDATELFQISGSVCQAAPKRLGRAGAGGGD